MLIPSMYAISHGAGRHFFNENYNKVQGLNTDRYHGVTILKRLLNISTIPHRSNTMPIIQTYITPDVYGENLFCNNILSPFHFANRKFYNYQATPLLYGKVQIFVTPRYKNTQLVNAKAIADSKTGQILMADFDGTYDMTQISLSVELGEKGISSLLPKSSKLNAQFRFLGNNITGKIQTYFNLPQRLSDSLDNVADTALMAKVRPVPLDKTEQAIYSQYFAEKNRQDSLEHSKNKKMKGDFVKDILWDMVGDKVLNNFTQDFGKESKGSIQLSPILNPFYMGYTQRKGFIFKCDLRATYSFNDNIQVAIGARFGYSFRLKQAYLSLPATFKYNNKHNGYLEMEYGIGNRINSNVIARNILGIKEKRDSTFQVDEEEITEFKDNYLRFTNHWMFNPHWGLDIGLSAHHREAIHPDFYLKNGYPASYRSVAPNIGVRWLPAGKKNLIITAQYEHSFSGFCGSNIPYGRFEADAKGIVAASSRRLFSMRGGLGFYTMRGTHWYFIDYANFCDRYIPGGWNDDWSGDFELLNSDWYNSSDYYLRSNFTYESPMILSSYLPFVGRFIEAERLYINTLFVKHLTPYTEIGYGFSSRFLSIGLFAAFKNADFYGVGCKFDLEIFRHW